MGKRNRRKSSKRVQRQVKKAARDGRVSAKEVKRIQKKAAGSKVRIRKVTKRAITNLNKRGKGVKLKGGAARRLNINKKGRKKLNSISSIRDRKQV